MTRHVSLASRRRYGIFLAAMVLFFSGCPAALLGGAAAGALGYQMGELTTTRNITLNQAYFAGQQALDELGIVTVTREKDGLSAVLIGRGSEEKKITIRMKKIFDDVTQVGIRVGLLGDELQSRLIFERMERYFDQPTTAEPSVSPALP